MNKTNKKGQLLLAALNTVIVLLKVLPTIL